MLRMLGAQQKREVKATQNLAIIVLFFMICWIPLYTINCVLAFCNECEQDINEIFMKCCIILSHLNSAGNPLLYAYHLRDFRAALKNFFCSIFSDAPLRPIQATKMRNSMQTNSNFNHMRLQQSLRETRSALNLTNSNKFVDSPLCYRSKSRSMHLPVPPKMCSLVSTSTALVVATTGETKRDMWQIPELPSNSEDKENSPHISIVHIPNSFHPKNDGKINSGYSQDSVFDDDDDDVFIDDTIPITDFKCEVILESAHKDNMNVRRLSDRAVISSVNCLSTSSPQLSRNLFLVETEVKLSTPRKFLRSHSANENADKKPKKNLRVSPFKAVGELLLQSKHSRSLSDGSNISSDSGTKRNNGVGVKSIENCSCST